MRKPLVIGHVRGKAATVAPGGPGEKLLIARIARSEHHELQLLFHNLRKHMIEKIQPLLIREARNKRRNGHIRAFRKAQLPLQSRLAGGLAGHVAQSVACGKRRVVRRVEIRRVDAVQKAGERMLAFPQHAVKPFAVIGR